MCETTIKIISGTHLTNTGKLFILLNFQKKVFRNFVAFIPLAIVLLISTSFQRNPDEMNAIEMDYFSSATADSLQDILGFTVPDSLVVVNREYPVMLGSIRTFYKRNGFKPVWTGYNGLNGRAGSLLYLIEHAREFGLEPSLYHISAISELKQRNENDLKGINKTALEVGMELLMTDAAFQLMVNLHAGYRSFDSTLYSEAWVDILPDILLHGIATGKIAENILSVQPRFIEYKKLQYASENFVKTNSLTDQWVKIKYPSKDTALLYAQAGKILKMLGYLPTSSNNTAITIALKEFQHFHGLEPDGKMGKNTVDALQQSTLYKYRILALNLDRLRKKENLDSNFLYVNIPAYRLKVYNGNLLKDTFRVIVGHPSTPTPLLAGRMERIIANPMWYVPRSITMSEILPKIIADSNYLKRNGFQVLDKNMRTVNYETLNFADIPESDFEYTLRQDRGLDNSLGQVKFIFSNPYAIYLHDTPGKTLFSKDLRAFSHGCVRVQNPERLAGYIINEMGSDSTNITKLIGDGIPHEFKITTPMSIQIMYVTCEAGNNGELYFYNDIYGTDKKELEQLASYMGI